MPLPEPISTPLRPDQIRRRMDELRLRYQQGVIAPEVYKGLCSQFQFRDSMGHLWSPGAVSSNWYRWDRTTWTPAEPPGDLFCGSPPTIRWTATIGEAAAAYPGPYAWRERLGLRRIGFFGESHRYAAARAAQMPPAPTCACGEPLKGTPFCKKCGRPAPAPQPEQAQARSSNCPSPSCGAKIETGQRFCGHCGRAVM